MAAAEYLRGRGAGVMIFENRESTLNLSTLWPSIEDQVRFLVGNYGSLWKASEQELWKDMLRTKKK